MDREGMEAKRLAEMKAVVGKLTKGASGSLQDMARMERKIYGAMNGLKAKLLQAWADEAKDDSARPSCPHCGGVMRQKQRVPKPCICEGGQVDLSRTRWWCDACGAFFSPLDNTATVAGYPITPEAGRVAVEESAERSYDLAMAHLRKSHRIYLGKELLEHLTQTVGSYWLDGDRATLEVCTTAREAPSAKSSTKRCFAFADGVMVHTDGDWHEARVGTVRSECVDGTEHKSSIARLCSTDELGDDLWRKACEMGYCEAEIKAFIADGSHWLWNQAERRFKLAIHILDFWYVCEHVSKCGNVFFGEGSDVAKQWVLQVKGIIHARLVGEALVIIESLQPRRSKAKCKAKHKLVTYLSNNRTRMDYPRYEKMGLPIGSGEVEAQCKTLVQTRCQQASMRWSSKGIEPLLRVRCAVLDGSYDRQFGQWPTNLAAWQTRRKRKQNETQHKTATLSRPHPLTEERKHCFSQNLSLCYFWKRWAR